jgi:hypothetical protein
MAPSLKEMFQMAGSLIWQSYGKRLVASSSFLGMAFQAMGEMMRRNEKSREGWMSGFIAGNHMSLLIYRITPAEGVVLHNYGTDRVAQLFGVNDLNLCIDPSTKGSEVEGGLFAEEFFFIMYFSLPESIPPRPLGGTRVRKQWSALY